MQMWETKPSPGADVGGAHGRLGNADGADRQRLRTHGCERHAQLEAHGRAAIGCGKHTRILGASVGAGAGPVVVQMCDRRDKRARLGMGATVAGCRSHREGRGGEGGWGHSLCGCDGSARSFCRCGGPGVSPVPVQMWPGYAKSRSRCGMGVLSLFAECGGPGVSPARPRSEWVNASDAPRAAGGEPSPRGWGRDQ